MKKHNLFILVNMLNALFATAQNVGIGTTAPVARLHVADSAVLFSGSTDMPPFTTTINPPVQGPGTRMIWFPSLGAFRAGYVNEKQWDRDSIGQLSFAAGYNTKAKGRISIAIGNNATASGIGSTSIGTGTTASGNASTALGYQTIASGAYSSATGVGSTASGEISTAMGYFTIASGYNSTAIGMQTIASGNYAAAMGFVTRAKSIGAFATGLFNDDTDNPNAITLDPADRIFQIGNGTDIINRSNALTVLRNGNTGIGTVIPAARLHVADSSVVFTRNTSPLNAAMNPPVQGAGIRMMWFPERGAFRAGALDDGSFVGGPGTCNTCPVHWDRDSIGLFSFATGVNTKASGASSIALGSETTASGNSATATGYKTRASGDVSTAVGDRTIASGNYSMASGTRTSATGYYSFAAGLETYAKASAAFTIGGWNDNTDNPGSFSQAGTDRIFQVGNGTADNARSNALTVLRNGYSGIGNTDPAYRIDISGRMRIRSGGSLSSSAGLWLNNIANNALYAFIGMENDDNVGFYGNNGAGWGLNMNITNGYVGIGTATPSQKLHVTGNILATGTITPSDARYKNQIEPIPDALSKLQQLNGVTYHMNATAFPEWNFTNEKQYGLIAQEVEKVFPEMVHTLNNEGYKGIDYVKLIPVLVESIKQQQQQIETLKKENKEIRKLIH